ncbi:MAG: ABC transporter permease [Solobacterium sp.]|nr:ABC transporter permease [Solobacterium sp.]
MTPKRNKLANIVRAYFSRPLNTIALLCFILVVLLCVFAPLIVPENYNTIHVNRIFEKPSWQHIFGRDRLGRDYLGRVLFGGRLTLKVASFATVIGFLLGTAAGILCGYFGNTLDTVVMRFIETLEAVPFLLLVLVFEIMLGLGTGNYRYALGVAMIPRLTHFVRAEVMKLRSQEYIEASRSIGCSEMQIIFRHILNNIFPILILQLLRCFAEAVLTCTICGYLQIGFTPPMADWGTLVADGYHVLRVYPWISLLPSGSVILTVLSLNLIGNGLHDALGQKQ